MSQWQIDVEKYWTPWEHEVCKLCFEDNPNAIWLVMVRCLKPHRHFSNTIRVVIDHKRMAMVSIRRVSTGLWRIARFKPCRKGESCGRKLRCWFPHGQHEVDMWNIKSRLIKGTLVDLSHIIIIITQPMTKVIVCVHRKGSRKKASITVV